MKFDEQMIDKYGPLLTITSAARILDRSPDGFRVSLHRADPTSKKLNSIRFHIGRRVYFPTAEFFQIIMNDEN